MKLIKVEAHGFKSFADKVVLNFDGGVVGIVGPNGSGKSNINDAIRWVLGEQSSKALRGDKMEDVIFAGSKTVKELDKAEVILTFDNSDGAVSVPHQIFTISRVMHRGKGGNEYYINGELARFRDIKEIAMESGISKSSLAIISQGTISDIAEASPEQRRAIIEEAAGTSKYQARKVEALRKLDTTEEALDKVRTIISELDKRLAPLRKQAEKAKIFIEKSEALKSVEVGLIVHDLHDFTNRLEYLNDQLSKTADENERLESRRSLIDTKMKESNSKKLQYETEEFAIRSKLEQISEELNQLQIRHSKITIRRQDIIEGRAIATPKEKMEAIKLELASANAKIEAFKSFESKISAEIAEKTENSLSIEKELNELKSKTSYASSELEKSRTRLSMLQEHKENKTNLFKGTKTIMENSSLFKGYKGRVVDLIKVESEFAPAIEAVLANALQHIVVDTSETAVKTINFLKQNNGGWATFIPMSSVQPKEFKNEHYMALKTQKGFIDLASKLVDTEDEYKNVRDFLLGNIIVAQTIEDANKLSKLLQQRYMIVTLDGDLIRPGGVMSGGAKDDNKNSLLQLDKNMDELKKIIPQLLAAKEKFETSVVELETKKKQLIEELAALKSQLNETKAKRADLNDKVDILVTQVESFSKEDLENSKVDEITQSIIDLEQKKTELDSQVKMKRNLITSINAELEPLQKEKIEVDNHLYNLSKANSKAINEKNQAIYVIESNRKRLSEHYQMTLEMAQESFKLEVEIEEARILVDQLQKEIKELGHVNLDSIQECEEVEERYNTLKENEAELSEAKNTILEAIAEMDKIIVNKIQETVAIVNEAFREVFKTMFGGGDAQVQYTDPENILETGIDIIAQPPGKSVKNLKLFSGGEKAIIAISLLFAIIKAKPIPLCILDEVEAALDEANVIRYAEFLQSLKKETQFIVITHRHGTMTKVDHLFGATMQKRGVTSFFSVELAKAKEMIADGGGN
ncbi:AAA family ATPase [Mycoplasma procyoni]|uniref:AAA family ATPase n=1 Tax=Mycoplasma procyoni TaxID=568784 RepID=UPI00197BB0C8|nr:AAA family ATPase [Mycoplasma procyoni]MBN3534354.1 AAA family ATPase [Mycoplasma procyoni]